jgi:hypothetical protein
VLPPSGSVAFSSMFRYCIELETPFGSRSMGKQESVNTSEYVQTCLNWYLFGPVVARLSVWGFICCLVVTGCNQLAYPRCSRDQYNIHRVARGSLDGLMKILEGQKIKLHAVNLGPKISPDMLYQALDLL